MPSNPVIPSTQNYLSTITNLYEPSFMRQLILKHPGELDMALSEIMAMLGRWVPMDAYSINHQEKDWVWDTLGVKVNVASPGVADTAITWTIPVAEHYNSGNSVYARVGDIVEFADSNRTRGQIISLGGTTNAITVTVHPLDATETLPALTAGDVVAVHTNAHAERSGQPAGRTPDLTTVTHTMQRIKETFTVSGTELTNASWVTVKGSDGKTMNCWYLAGENDARFRFMKSIDLAMLTEKGVTTGTGTTGESVMLGVIPFIENGGNIVNYPLGAFSLSDLDLMVDLLDAQKVGGKEYIFLGGLPIDRGFEDFIKDDLQEGIRYATFDGPGNSNNAKEVAVSLGFKSMSRSRYVFHRRQFDEFTNPRTLGAAGYAYENYALLIPSGSQPSATSQTGQKVPMFEMLYKAKGGYSRKYEHFMLGSAGNVMKGRETTDVDELVFNWRCEVGTRLKHAEAWGLFRP